jgi:hypothetical protein
MTSIQHSFDHLYPVLPEYIRYRVKRAVNDDPSGNATEIFQQTLSHLYRKNLKLESPRVVVCTGIVHDGLGDLMHAVHASTVLKNNLFSPQTYLICSMSDYSKKKSVLTGDVLKAADECIFTHHFDEDKELQTKAQKIIDTAEVVIKVATGSPMADLRGLSIDEVKHALYFSELGLGYIHGLGFAPHEIGVPIPPEIQQAVLDDSDLADLLAERSNRPNYSLHLGYLKQYPLHNAFFATNCLAAKAHNASIDFVMPMKDICSIGWMDAEEWENGGVDFGWVLNQLGLKEISLYARDKDNKLICKQTRKFGEAGLDVRIINPFPISSSSFACFSSQSEWSTGCTGDFSFLGTVLGKTPQIPFYEILGHKTKFFDGFMEFLKAHLPEKSPLFPFFESLLKLQHNPPTKELFRIAQTMAQAIQMPEVRTQMKDLSKFIKERFNFNEVLLDYVSREISHVRYPILQDLEQQLLNTFLKDPGSLDAAYKQLEHAMIKTTSQHKIDAGQEEDQKEASPQRAPTKLVSKKSTSKILSRLYGVFKRPPVIPNGAATTMG